MSDAKKLEVEVRKYGGENGEEIIESVRKLAEVDVKIKSQMDEIERIDETLANKHNELADRINELLDSACKKDESESGSEDDPGKSEKPSECKKAVKVEVHLVKVPAPPPVFALLDYLFR